MIADYDTDTVFVSDLLTSRHPQVECELRAALGNRLRRIAGTKDIWCRDFMPIQLSKDRFLQFRYDPDYLRKDPQLRTPNGAGLLDLPNCSHSDLIVDGGNVVRWDDAAIMTEKIYRENADIERRCLRHQLRSALEVDRLIVIPKEPYDRIGHADGMMHFLNEKTLLVNDYRKVDPAFGERIANVLQGFELVQFPYCPTAKVIDGIESAEGVYINFLQINDTILLPVFDSQQDDKALTVLGQVFPGTRVVPIRSNELAAGGGVLNCATWNVKINCK